MKEKRRGRLKYFRISRVQNSRGKHAWVRSQAGDRVQRARTQRRGFQRSFEVAGRANGTRGSAECRPSGWQYPCPVLSPRIILPYLSRTTHSRTLILSSPPFVSATVRPLSLCPACNREKIIAF